jgi:hypothetical protein
VSRIFLPTSASSENDYKNIKTGSIDLNLGRVEFFCVLYESDYVKHPIVAFISLFLLKNN